MKRLLASLLLTSALLLFITGRPGAQGETLVRISPAQVTLEPGQSTTIAVEVVAVSEMRAFEVTIDFDPALIDIPDSSLVDGGFLAAGWPSPANGVDDKAGLLTYGYAIEGNDVSSGSGTLFTFTVQAKQAPGETLLTIVESELVHLDHNPSGIEHELEHGRVRVTTDAGYQVFLPLILR